jgi:tRNA U34 5-carboxymethylaminomethyl modifying GTPase MnmE/TrmE
MSADATLRAEVVKALHTLEELVQHRELLGVEVTDMITSTVADVRRRLDRKELAVVVVGEKKAGKSTFLNAILGARVLGAAVREYTGTVTFIKRAPRPWYRATLRKGGVVEFQDLEAAERSRIEHEIATVRQRVGQGSDRLVLRRDDGDGGARLDQATTEHTEAVRRRVAAEAMFRECERHHAAVFREVQRLIGERDTEQDALTQLEKRLAEQRTALQDAERALSSTIRELRDQRLREAEDKLSAAEQECERARAALAEAQRAEDLARLRVLHAQLAVLEEASLARFRSEIHALTDMERRGPDVVELTIGFPAAHLPEGITIIDTPGVNTDNAPNRERAWEVIRREADGCVLVSDLQQVLSQSTRDFVQEVRSIIPHILLVMTKVDRALANAEEVGDLEPWQQVEDARRTGVRRFAKKVGRAPEEVFSIAVAAELALRGDSRPDGLGHRFPGEVAKLFRLLESERAIVLGARAATAVRDCAKRIHEALAQAEAKYNQRIAELEQQRLPDPRKFQARQLAKVKDALRARVDAIVERALEVLSDCIDEVNKQWVRDIRACSDEDEVKAAWARIKRQQRKKMAWVMSKVHGAVSKGLREAIKELEEPLLKELRKRYRIVQQMTGRGRAVQLRGIGATSAAMRATTLHVGVDSAIERFVNERFAFGAGGALAGAAIGTMVFPGIGTAIGGALGALARYFRSVDSLRSDVVKELKKYRREKKKILSTWVASRAPDLERRMREALAQGLRDAVSRFEAWIDEVMAAELEQIDRERQKLSHLIEMREKLVLHEGSLAKLQQEAAAVSQGLCA